MRLLPERALLVLGCIALCLCRPSQGHEDPLGDVHPTVLIENGHFAVYFVNNVDGPFAKYQTHIQTDGKIIKEREFISRISWEEFDEITDRQFWSFYQPPGQSYLQHSYIRPCFPEDRLIWLGLPLIDLSYATEAESSLFFHISAAADLSDVLQNEFPLYLAKVDRLTGIVRAAELGNPARIYQFARASEVRVIGTKAYICWAWSGQLRHISTTKEQLFRKDRIRGWFQNMDSAQYYRYVTRLVLSQWDLKTDRIEHLYLPDKINWNTSISMNAIGNQLLIAWHIGYTDIVPNSKIMTRLANTSEFSKQHTQLFPLIDFEP